MKYAKQVLGGAGSGVTAASVVDATALSAVVDQGEVAVLVNDSLQESGNYVSIMEALRTCRETLRESKAVQAFAGTATQFSSCSHIPETIKDPAKAITGVENTTLLNVIAAAGTVALVLPNSGGLSVLSRSAIEQCIDRLGELDFNP
jgi:hypothetical protein